ISLFDSSFSTTPGRDCCGRGVSLRGEGCVCWEAAGRGLGFDAGAAVGSGLPSGRANLRFLVSTTTAFVRPCEKLCRTVPCSGRLSVSVFFVLTSSVLSSPVLLSVIPYPLRLPPRPTPYPRESRHDMRRAFSRVSALPRRPPGRVKQHVSHLSPLTPNSFHFQKRAGMPAPSGRWHGPPRSARQRSSGCHRAMLRSREVQRPLYRYVW